MIHYACKAIRFALIGFFALHLAWAQAPCVIKTVWGDHLIRNPYIAHFIQHPVLQRLNDIDQSGPVAHLGYIKPFSRFKHSVGVLALLDRVNAPFKEQVAGLFHDASHTALSHVGDDYFGVKQGAHSYQDSVHLEFLNHYKIHELIQDVNMKLTDMNPDRTEYTALEQPLPNLCADRIQYIIHTGVLCDRITRDQAKNIVDDLDFKDGSWFFTGPDIAQMFADLSLYFTEHFWGAPWNCAIYDTFGKMLKMAVREKLITEDNIKYGVDADIMNVLNNATHPFIQQGMARSRNIHNNIVVNCYDVQSFYMYPKFRGVDPYVKQSDQLIRLTQLSPTYKNNFDRVKTFCETGYSVFCKQ